jgi:hypothetical protein
MLLLNLSKIQFAVQILGVLFETVSNISMPVAFGDKEHGNHY